MASKALFRLGTASNKWILTCIRDCKPKSSPQTTLHHVRCFRRIRDPNKNDSTPFTPEANVPVELPPASKLWKSFGFTIAFSGASIVGAAIWEYENIRARTQKLISPLYPKRMRRIGWRGYMENWWNTLNEGQKLFAPICFANVLVFLAWRIPALQSTMIRYFCSNPTSSATCWPMVLSTFSHYSLLHLAANMFVLHSFIGPSVSVLGKEQFMALYLTSGVVSSFTSHFYKTLFLLPGLSLGASGAIMGILGFTCTQFPDIRLSIIFLPMYTFTADMAIKALMMFDTLGCVMKWSVFDHAAHLGGAFTGIFWQKWGNAYIWQNREPILTYWHELRGPPRSG